MSRKRTILSEHVTVFSGNDNVTGGFIQVADSRYAEHKLDKQGEGWVVDYDDVSKFGTNLINISLPQLHEKETILKKCDEFITKINKTD